MIERHRDSHFRGDIEYGFRQGLLREAAYSLLTPADLSLAHRLAGRFLQDVAEADQPMADALDIGEHYKLGGELEEAAAYYLRAAEQALAGNDLGASLDFARRGIACLERPGTDSSSRPAADATTRAELASRLNALLEVDGSCSGEWGLPGPAKTPNKDGDKDGHKDGHKDGDEDRYIDGDKASLASASEKPPSLPSTRPASVKS